MRSDTEASEAEDFSVPDILMVNPEFFDVNYEINPHMDQQTDVDVENAKEQWNNLKQIYEEDLGLDVHVADPVEGFPDMVFTANHGVAYQEDGEFKVMPAKMRHDQRVGEVEPVMEELEEIGIETAEQPEYFFEGSGDAMTHPDPEKMWVGYGPRTQEEMIEEISEVTGKETVGIELLTDDFYHLDTCFEHLNDETALVYTEAIAEEGLQKIQDTYDTTIEVPDHESDKMAGNAHCPDGENVIIHEEAYNTAELLEEYGFEVTPTDTSEFIKSGGSVYCMKMQLK